MSNERLCPDCGAPFHDLEVSLPSGTTRVRDCDWDVLRRQRRKSYEPPAIVESRDASPSDVESLADAAVRVVEEFRTQEMLDHVGKQTANAILLLRDALERSRSR